MRPARAVSASASLRSRSFGRDRPGRRCPFPPAPSTLSTYLRDALRHLVGRLDDLGVHLVGALGRDESVISFTGSTLELRDSLA